MKSFFQFLNEAQSQASMQARKLNLVSDGHGGWLDSRGKFVATTEDGKLQFVDKKKKKAEDDKPAQQKTTQSEPEAKTKKPATQTTGAKKAEAGEGDQTSGESTETLTVAFGRFNPPTVGHGKLLAAAKKASGGEDLKIYPSRSQDPKKNPLDPDMKVSFMKKMFPDYSENIINDDEMKSIFNVLVAADEAGYKNVNIIVGSDRQAEFENLATKYNGELYNFDNIRVISAGVRDADAEGVEGMSASKMRSAATEGDFESFKMGIPDTVSDTVKRGLYNDVRKYMGVKEEYIQERELTLREKRLKEKYVLELKKKSDEFKKKYGDKWLDVIYATATNMAKKQSIKESSYLKNYEDFIGWLND